MQKPFDLDELVGALGKAVEALPSSEPCDADPADDSQPARAHFGELDAIREELVETQLAHTLKLRIARQLHAYRDRCLHNARALLLGERASEEAEAIRFLEGEPDPSSPTVRKTLSSLEAESERTQRRLAGLSAIARRLGMTY
jgi:hypothetical protein